VNVNVKRNDAFVDVNFHMATLRYSGPLTITNAKVKLVFHLYGVGKLSRLPPCLAGVGLRRVCLPMSGGK